MPAPTRRPSGTPGAGGDSDASTRRLLAGGIVGVSILGIVIISSVAIAVSGSSDRAETSRLVFSSVLPLLGTWVGTVLAFYFARENLRAATDSTIALAGLGEQSTSVKQVMIPEAEMTAFDLGSNDDASAITLADIYARMRGMSPPARRLPIRNASGAVLYVIHDSTLTAYADKQNTPTAEISGTLADLLAIDEFKQFIEALGFVSENATVADARAKMGSIQFCNDVFVTATGERHERALGWFTNTLLAGIQ
jgi:hypothetical protein